MKKIILYLFSLITIVLVYLGYEWSFWLYTLFPLYFIIRSSLNQYIVFTRMKEINNEVYKKHIEKQPLGRWDRGRFNFSESEIKALKDENSTKLYLAIKNDIKHLNLSLVVLFVLMLVSFIR